MNEKNKRLAFSSRITLSGFGWAILVMVVFCVINVIVFYLISKWPNLVNITQLSKDSPLGIVGAIFTHTEPKHLIGNLYGIFFALFAFIFISQADSKKLRIHGSLGFLCIIFGAGIGANFILYLISFVIARSPSWGASGVIFGVLGLLTTKIILNLRVGYQYMPAGFRDWLHIRSLKKRKKKVSFARKQRMIKTFRNMVSLLFLLMIIWILIDNTVGLILDIDPTIDYLAHELGFVLGAVGSWLFFKKNYVPKPSTS